MGDKIAFGGGCHWCTEAVFQNLKGVQRVEQGFISSYGKYAEYSEAVIVHFDPLITSISDLIKIHLHTHSSTSAHKMRRKYRSAIYIFSEEQKREALNILKTLSKDFSEEIITRVLVFREFKSSTEKFQNYFIKNPSSPFCRKWIFPKLELLQNEFPDHLQDDLEIQNKK